MLNNDNCLFDDLEISMFKCKASYDQNYIYIMIQKLYRIVK